MKLRLLGGIAIWLCSPSAAAHPRLKRDYPDIDFVGLRAQSREISDLFELLGYEPNRRFNALHGYRRLIFYGPLGHVDLFLDRFEMCHTVDLRQRLLEGYLTLPVADLLVTKLQIVELNPKDLRDTLTLLLDHDVGLEESPDLIDLSYLSGLTGADWGLFTTLSDNLARTLEAVPEFLNEEEGQRVTARIRALLDAMEQSPKTVKWHLRAKVGRRVEWYELPEEVAR